MKKRVKLPYGEAFMEFTVPGGRLLGVIGERRAAHGKIERLLPDSLDAPVAGAPLEDLARDSKKVLIVVPDATRKCHLEKILPHLLKRVMKKGRRVDIVIATGMHDRLDKTSMARLLGAQALKQCDVFNHSYLKSSLAGFGRTKSGIPIYLNKMLRNHDFILTAGVIEPHLYAGYSGGAKTVAIGLAGESVINATHGIKFLDDPRTRIGSIGGNPFQETLWEIQSKVNVGFAVNIVNDSEGRPVAVFAGEPLAVFREGVRAAKDIFEASLAAPADMVVCGIGYPKDVNLYQSTRAINYIVNVERPILKKGGLLIIAAEMRDGIGSGLSEKRFYDCLSRIQSPARYVAAVKRRGCLVGEHRAYMAAKPLLDYRVIFVSKKGSSFMKALCIPCYDTVEKALAYCDRVIGQDAKIYVVPRALATIPTLAVGEV